MTKEKTAAKQPEHVPASEVKNSWHELLDRVSRTHEEIVITRYGKPIVRLTPVGGVAERASVFGCLSGTVRVKGDIVQSTGEAWEADG